MQKTKLIAHRGASAYFPENSMLAIKKALFYADMIEIDVWRCSTGELIVMHDESVERTSNGSGLISSFSLKDIQQLDIGMRQRPSTLSEIIIAITKKIPLIIELKDMGAASELVRVIQGFIKQGWGYNHFIVSSFDHDVLSYIFKLDKSIARAPLFQEINTQALLSANEKLQPHSIHVDKKLVTVDLIKEAQKIKMPVYSYTVNDLAESHQLIQLGVEGIFSDALVTFAHSKKDLLIAENKINQYKSLEN